MLCSFNAIRKEQEILELPYAVLEANRDLFWGGEFKASHVGALKSQHTSETQGHYPPWP